MRQWQIENAEYVNMQNIQKEITKDQSKSQTNNTANEISVKVTNRLASSSLRFASISLLGGYFGRLDGSHA